MLIPNLGRVRKRNRVQSGGPRNEARSGEPNWGWMVACKARSVGTSDLPPRAKQPLAARFARTLGFGVRKSNYNQLKSYDP